MSDELPPPPLRLKPRQKIEPENAASSPAEVQPTSEVASNTSSEPAPPRLKLRPKLDLESAPAEVIPTPVPAEPVAPAAPSISLKPRLSITQPTPGEPITPPLTPAAGETIPASIPTPPTPEQPKFKLKEKTPLPAADPPPVIAQARNTVLPPFPPPPRVATQTTSTPVLVPRSTTPPAFPVVTSASPEQPAPALPPLLPKPAAHSVSEAAEPRQSSVGKILMLVAAVVLVGGGYFGYKLLTESTAADIPETPIAKEAPKRPTSPSTTLNELGAIPAQAIKKAEDVVAAVQANQAAAAEDVLADETLVPPPLKKAAPKPAENPAAPVTSTTELSPGIRATTIADVDGEASPEFRAWVAQVRISGVFQGTPARVLINGKTVPAGQLVDEALGISFDGVDPSTKSLVFRDRTGATVTRKF